jgi:hypothetical protein
MAVGGFAVMRVLCGKLLVQGTGILKRLKALLA